MKRWWGGSIFTGSFNFVLNAKLRALKAILKTWNKEMFGLIEAKKGETLREGEIFSPESRRMLSQKCG